MVNSRDDAYASKRDYQQLRECETVALCSSVAGATLRYLEFEDLVDGTSPFICAGGYFRSETPLDVELVILDQGHTVVEHRVRVQDTWTRVGVIAEARGLIEHFAFRLMWQGAAALEVWGLDAGRPQLPERVEALDPTLAELRASHLVPEGFYLSHAAPWALGIRAQSKGLKHLPGGTLTEKKCSFDERWLPTEVDRPGKLAFHAHSDKPTKHQNECRACKKWRINRLLNPIRTTSQLNESSVLTRERKLLLREPAVLERFKQDNGIGLKDFIWKRFDRKCFRCMKELASPSEMDLDHTRPLAYLWPLDEHATALCPDCNNLKRHQFPVDFYDDQQLARLSDITGLSLHELQSKSINQVELDRILEDLASFAEEWDPRLFRSIQRRVLEHSGPDLFAVLADQDPDVLANLQHALTAMPASATDEPE
jgi:hypothetical protein